MRPGTPEAAEVETQQSGYEARMGRRAAALLLCCLTAACSGTAEEGAPEAPPPTLQRASPLPPPSSNAERYARRDELAALALEAYEENREELSAEALQVHTITSAEVGREEHGGTVILTVTSAAQPWRPEQEEAAYALAVRAAKTHWRDLAAVIGDEEHLPDLSIRMDGRRWRCSGRTMVGLVSGDAGYSNFALGC